MKPIERFKVLRDKGLCWQCLNSGELKDNGRHKDGKCYDKFVCQHSDHLKYDRKKHIFVCDHQVEGGNKKLLELYYKQRIWIQKDLPESIRGILNTSFGAHSATVDKASVVKK